MAREKPAPVLHWCLVCWDRIPPAEVRTNGVCKDCQRLPQAYIDRAIKESGYEQP